MYLKHLLYLNFTYTIIFQLGTDLTSCLRVCDRSKYRSLPASRVREACRMADLNQPLERRLLSPCRFQPRFSSVSARPSATGNVVGYCDKSRVPVLLSLLSLASIGSATKQLRTLVPRDFSFKTLALQIDCHTTSARDPLLGLLSRVLRNRGLAVQVYLLLRIHRFLPELRQRVPPIHHYIKHRFFGTYPHAKYPFQSLLSALRYIEAFQLTNVSTSESSLHNLATSFLAGFTNLSAPASMNSPAPKSNEDFTNHVNNNLRPVLQHFVVTPKEIHVNETCRQVTIWATGKPEFKQEAMGDGPKDQWDYTGEYIFILDINADGKIVRILEFLDSLATTRLRGLMVRAKENMGLAGKAW
jgi:ketosteroid isomerase-like protein